MIPRVHDIEPENDNYARLAEYIADAKKAGEKCLMKWTAGCDAGQDYHLAVSEVVATQKMKIRTERNLTYHMSISFRPEDDKKLTPDVFKEIEEEFAKALGYQDHQRHCGVHTNTNNTHIHIAYNMIHPITKARHEQKGDYFKLGEAAKRLEKRYNLAIDPGAAKDKGGIPKRENEKAKKAEAHSGLKSFHSFVQERKGTIKGEVEQATSWQDLHKRLALHGVEIRLRGNGCIVAALKPRRRGKNLTVRASSVGREFSKAKLEKKFGKFEKSAGGYEVKDRYGPEPAKKLRSAKEKKLWALYLRDAKKNNYQLRKSFKQFSFQMSRYFAEGIER